MEENKKNNSKAKALLAIIGVLLITVGFMIGYFLSPNNKSNNNLEEKNQNNTSDNTSNNDNIESVEVSDEIRKVYEKYHIHFDDNPRISNIEYTIYNSEVFEVANMTDISSYADVIYKNAEKELAPFIKVEKDGHSKYILENGGKEIIKKYFKMFFGDNLEFSNEVLGSCLLSYIDGKYIATNYCGESNSSQLETTIYKYENDDNNLYIYEHVRIYDQFTDENNESEERYNYKWTYNKQADGQYYFLKAERL